MIQLIRKYILGRHSTNENTPFILLILCAYVAFSSTYTAILSGPPSSWIRLGLGAGVILGFIISERLPTSYAVKAFTSPLLPILFVTAGAVYFPGDILVFVYTIGAALVSLSYLKPNMVLAYLLTIGAVQGILIFVLGQNLMGNQFNAPHNYVGLLSSVLLNYVIYVICKRYARAIDRLTVANDIANKAADAKSRFLSNMSHEIRTPLNAIIGMTAVGKMGKEGDNHQYILQKIENASLHLLDVVNDVLDIAKLESGRLELAEADFSFHKVMQRAVNIISFNMQEKGQHLHVSIDEKIPDMLVGDAQRLTQVLMNLLGNAVKFTPTGGKIQLYAQLLKEEAQICTLEIRIIDSGIGISRAQQVNLFKAFYQAETSTARKFGGTGLGLTITKNIIDVMGGDIRVASEVGKGASFIFTIQLTRSHQHDEAETETNEPAENTTYHGKHVLVAEDIEINCEIITALLEPTGLRVTCVDDGAKAIRAFTEAPTAYDLIFMDIQMPEMDGYTATRQIRALNTPTAHTIPILAMTANVMSQDVAKCLDAGMNDHLGKPLDMNAMHKLLNKYLNG